MLPVKNMNHLMTGVFLILVALLAFYLSSRLSTFTSVGLGSGFVPRMIAALQMAFGILLVGSAFLTVGQPDEKWQLRPLMALAAIAFFGVAIEPLGLVVAVIGLVLIGCVGSRDTKPTESLLLAVGSAAVSTLIFVTLLGLTIPVWPTIVVGG